MAGNVATYSLLKRNKTKGLELMEKSTNNNIQISNNAQITINNFQYHKLNKNVYMNFIWLLNNRVLDII